MKRIFDPEKATKALKAAAQMPPLVHSASEPFDIKSSAVVQWLIQQPDILQAMFGHYHDQGAIVFDRDSGTWKGVQVSE